ncbi:cupin domain-containing protein [Saccharibacillus sacchari]|uniref:Cupin domain-containing protein n=1 Tax=Saccharibacillus sacchari TaxID=456493 RepID=A0ACC6P7Z5_9BACL
MRIYDFDEKQGKTIDRFGSENLTVTGLLGASGDTPLVCMYIGKNGTVGRHDAVSQQLFMVVSGEGWVSGADGERVAIRAGQAAFWEKNESHASGSESGMTVIVAESEQLNMRL